MNEQSADRRVPSPAAVRQDIYWLRAVGLLGVFGAHCSRMLALLQDPTAGMAASDGSALVAVFELWAMPMLFLASGAAMAIAVREQSPGRFMLLRARRLLLPMALGLLVLVPPQVYLERRLASQPGPSLLAVYRDLLNGAPLPPHGAGLSGSHLWYLLVFFAFSLLLVLLLPLARTRVARRAREKAVQMCTKPAMLLVLALPFTFKGVLDALVAPPGMGVWSLLEYLVVFLYGHLLVSDRRVGLAVHEIGPYAMMLAALGTPTALYVYSQAAVAAGSCCVVGMAVVGFVRWCWVLSFLYIGRVPLRLAGPALRWAGRASMPFYVLHQAVIVAVGYGIAGWRLPAGVSYSLLVTLALAATLALCEFVVGRVALLKRLFGFSDAELDDAPSSAMPAAAR